MYALPVEARTNGPLPCSKSNSPAQGLAIPYFIGVWGLAAPKTGLIKSRCVCSHGPGPSPRPLKTVVSFCEKTGYENTRHLDGVSSRLSGDASIGNGTTVFPSAETVRSPPYRLGEAQIMARFGGAGAAVAVPI